MRVYALLLLFVVECWGTQWKAINDFKEAFKEYSVAAINTISSIEYILHNSRSDSDLFLSNIYSDNLIVNRITGHRSSKDNCFARFSDVSDLKFSYQIQLYQLQNPLRSRIVDIMERIKNINSSIDIYQGLTDSKFWGCKSRNGSCLEETNEWLESAINSLSCAIYPNCSNHSIRKRSSCSSNEFSCPSGNCIDENYFCDGSCNCDRCWDEPSDCVRNCDEFRCSKTFRCVPYSYKCNGINDCGDWSDEDGCQLTTTTTTTAKPVYSHQNCSIDAGDFFCNSKKCISLELVCDGYNDCGDWSDEGNQCYGQQCSPECGRKGGVCFIGPKGPQCLYECPPRTYETSIGCNLKPEVPLATLAQVLEDTPRLTTRYAARLKYLKTKTIMALSKSLEDVVKCKKGDFTLLSKIIDFSTIIHQGKDVGRNRTEELPTTPGTAVDVTVSDTVTKNTKSGVDIDI